MRLFFFGLAGAAAIGLTAAATFIYPVLIAIAMEAHGDWAGHVMKDLPAVLVLALWVGLVGAYLVTRKRS